MLTALQPLLGAASAGGGGGDVMLRSLRRLESGPLWRRYCSGLKQASTDAAGAMPAAGCAPGAPTPVQSRRARSAASGADFSWLLGSPVPLNGAHGELLAWWCPWQTCEETPGASQGKETGKLGAGKPSLLYPSS